MDGRNLTDTACLLYGTKSCALLNMRSCEECPLKGRVADTAIKEDLKLFCDLQPEGTVAQLFESETCTLCKDEPKGQSKSFAIYDLAHEEPKKLAKRRWPSKQVTGFMVPLQFACCSACRRRMLLISYLPLITTIVLTAIVLPFVTIERMAETLRNAAPWLPFALVLGAIAGGYLMGKLLSVLYRKRCETVMFVDVREHPVVREMNAKGWHSLFADRKPHIAFTSKRIDKGLGSAPSAVYAMPDDVPAPDGENSD